MASLKEIKTRIGSVSSTLKITSAMKMVSSAKLRKAQAAIGGMSEYQRSLAGMLRDVSVSGLVPSPLSQERPAVRVALLCISSNSSLCGAFNTNVIRQARQAIDRWRAEGAEVDIYTVGRKVTDALGKAGYAIKGDYSYLASRPSYGEASRLGNHFIDSFLSGVYDRIEIVHSHFVSAASQPVTVETYLPLKPLDGDSPSDTDWITEPDRDSLIAQLIPKVMLLKMFTVLLDSSAAEHAARTLAMQIATDNANSLLVNLTLEYNKGRQQKITSEILDLVGGMQE